MVNQIAPRKRGRPPKKPGDPPTKKNMPVENPIVPGDNARMVATALDMLKQPRVKTDDEVEERIIWYFEYCILNDVKPSTPALALALGYDRRTLSDWLCGVTIVSERRIELIKRAKAVINAITEDMMQNGKMNPVVGIFLLKNNMGYKDQADIVVTPQNPLGPIEDRKLIEQRYLEELPD